MTDETRTALGELLTSLYAEQSNTYNKDENSKADYLIKSGRVDGIGFAIASIEDLLQPTAEELRKGE